jgi:hypothetical protein
VYQYTTSVQRELPGKLVFTGAYVGSQGRTLFLRNFTNRIVRVDTNPTTGAAIITRQFDIVQPDGTIQRPYAEIDYKTSGGSDNYNSMQLSLARRFNSGLTLNSQYTLARSYGNTAGSNEALTAGNPFDYAYDIGWNAFDVRHTYNLSVLYSLPFAKNAAGTTRALLGGWDVGSIVNGRSGLPIDVRITRPDVVFVDGAGTVFTTAAPGRTAVINTLGGGSSRNVRRPILVPGVNPYIKDGLQWLNPAAFSTPAPGEFGNLKRGQLRGPSFNQVDLVVNKKIFLASRSNVEVRYEVYNLFNRDNFTNPVATLPSALGTNANQVQPNQPFSAASAGTFGQLTGTVGRTVGIGTNRQMQFALRLNF